MEPQAEISVALVALPPREALEPEWRKLEERSDGSFFVGWSWIGCWIESLGGAADLRLVRATLDDRTVGLGILTASRERRHWFISSRTLRLHATGNPEFDVLTVECNGFLLERGLAEMAGLRMLAHLVEQEHEWDELYLDALWHLPPRSVLHANTRASVRSSACYYVDLAKVRARSGDYLALLGPKTRSRIRRSCQEYEKFGTLRLQAAADASQALQFLDGLKALHQSYWVRRGEPGSFASPFFERFHKKLVQDAFARGEIQLIAIDAGARRLGFLYNFIYRGRVYNYQSGFDYGLCEKHNRPGLVAHSQAVVFNAACGHSIYDLLAGDVQYKRELGTAAGAMSWLIVQRDRFRFRIEHLGRALRQRFRRPAGGRKA